MKYHSKVVFSIILLILFSLGLVTLISPPNSIQSNKSSDQNVSTNSEPFLFYAMGPNGEIPDEMVNSMPPVLHPSPTGNTILLTDDFNSYKTEAEFIASPWDFSEPVNTHCNLKENKTLAISGKRCIEFYDNNASAYTGMWQTFTATSAYLYLKIYLYAKQTTGLLFVWVRGPGGSFLITMGTNSNQWAIGTNGGITNTGTTYTANKWYQVELFANILKNSYDFYVDNTCLASNVSFYSKGATYLNSIYFLTGETDISDPNYYYIDSLEVAIPPKILCLLVKFSDKANSNSVDAMYQKIFTNAGSFRNYYKEDSYNKYTVAGTVTPWITMPQTMVYYGKDSPPGHDNYYGSRDRLPDDAILTANPLVDFSIYDHVLIFHAGNDQAGSGVTDDIWSACAPPSSGYSYGPVDGVYINHICWVSETEGIGGACHEFGHMLDLPDLYNYNPPPDHFVGYWGLMDAGSWNGPSSDATSPAHMMAWCKMKLGWLASTNIETMTTSNWVNGVYLYPLETKTSKEQVIKIEIDTNHYYLVENRLKTGFDTYLPDQGIIISYIDETLASGYGIVKVQNSHPGSTDFDEAAWDLSGSSEWQVFRDLTRKIYITVGPKSSNVYLMYVDRYPSGNRTYNTYSIPASSTMYWNISIAAGRIIHWDWWFGGSSADFRILRPSDGQDWEYITGVNHDGGIFRAPTTDLYQFRVRNNDLFTTHTLHLFLIAYYSPFLEIYDFTNMDLPTYRTNQFTIRLQVRNTQASLVEGVTATLNLPSGLNLVDGWDSAVSIEDLSYYEYATTYWEIYAATTGTKSIQIVMTSTWGGSPTINMTVEVLLDTISPILNFKSPTPSNYTAFAYNDISIAWDVYEYETSLKITSIYLNTTFIANTTGTSYNLLDLPDGVYYCRIIAYDIENNAGIDVRVFRIDTTKPSRVSIIAPPGGNWYTDINLIADVYDSGIGIDHVQFYKGNPKSGGILIGSDYLGTDGWSYMWYTSSSDDGANTIYLRAYDALGQYNDSIGVLLYIDNSVPTLPVCNSIDPDKKYSGNISIEILVDDYGSGILCIEFWLGDPSSGGLLLYNDTNISDGWTYTWSTTKEDDGTNPIYIRVYDKCGNQNSLWVNIKIKNAQSNSFSIIIIIVAIAAAAGVSAFLVFKYTRKQKKSKLVLPLKPLKEVPPPMVKQAPAPPPLPPMVKQAPAPSPLPPMVKQAPAPSPLPPMVKQAPAPSPLPPMVKQAPAPPPPAIRQVAPPDKLQIYRCPNCSAPLSAQTIENLKIGQIDICSNCQTHLTGELIFPLPKKQIAAELLQDDSVETRISRPLPEELATVPIKISEKEIEEIITALGSSAPPSKPNIQKEPSLTNPSSFEDVIKSLETKLKGPDVQPVQITQVSEPIQVVQPVQPAQAPPIVEYKCPFCNTLLPPQKIANLTKGINVLCPNCLKSIESKQFNQK